MAAFFKLSGAGNDFIALVEPRATPAAETLRTWCRRALSLGADGVLVLHRESAGTRMIHHNADGGRSDLCLNGSRCAAQLAFHLGWGDEDGRLNLLTDAGTLAAQRLDEHAIRLSLPNDLPGEPRVIDLEVEGTTHRGWKLQVGVPHLVLAWPESLDRAPVRSLGRALRRPSELMPEGANVDFVRFDPPHRLEIRTFERGVEAETLACGTGVVAAVQVGLAAGHLTLPIEALTASGFRLKVDGRRVENRWHELSLAGDARLVAGGELMPGATAIPETLRWS